MENTEDILLNDKKGDVRQMGYLASFLTLGTQGGSLVLPDFNINFQPMIDIIYSFLPAIMPVLLIMQGIRFGLNLLRGALS